jgi:hypothetical protein
MIGEVGLPSPSPRQPKHLAAMKSLIPVERLWELYEYNPLTGTLISKRRGKPLSTKERKRGDLYGRINFRVDGRIRAYSTQAVVWAWCTGTWPPDGFTVDHIDRIRTNNRFHNLRLATPREQAHNQEKFKGGVSKLPSGRYRARIHANQKLHHLGAFNTKEEAQSAYAAALTALPH